MVVIPNFDTITQKTCDLCLKRDTGIFRLLISSLKSEGAYWNFFF